MQHFVIKLINRIEYLFTEVHKHSSTNRSGAKIVLHQSVQWKHGHDQLGILKFAVTCKSIHGARHFKAIQLITLLFAIFRSLVCRNTRNSMVKPSISVRFCSVYRTVALRLTMAYLTSKIFTEEKPRTRQEWIAAARNGQSRTKNGNPRTSTGHQGLVLDTKD